MFDSYFNFLPTSKDKLLEEIVKEITKYIEQNRPSKRGVNKKTRNEEYLITSKLLDSLYLNYFSIPKTWLSLSLRASHYTKKRYGYKNIKKVFDALRNKNLIKIKLGTEYSNKVTRIFPSEILIAKFKRIGFRWRYYPYDNKSEAIILRDKVESKKINLKLPKSKLIDKYKNNLNKINIELNKHCIALDLDDKALALIEKELINNTKKDKQYKLIKKHIHYSLNFSLVNLRRIFSNNNFELGGRFYGGWWQYLPSKFRPHITIDGYKTSEVDFSTISLRLLYAKEKINIQDKKDLYDIGLSGSKDYLYRARKLVKKFINAIINDEKGNFKLDKSELRELKLTHKQLINRVNEYHRPISKYFGTGIGLNLMYIDSVIAEDVMLSFLKQGIVVLPIHDSFIIRHGYELSLKAQMKVSFNKVVTTTTTVKATGPSLPQHFYSKPIEGIRNEIYSVDDIKSLVMNNNDKIYNNYLSSWYEWKQTFVR